MTSKIKTNLVTGFSVTNLVTGFSVTILVTGFSVTNLVTGFSAYLVGYEPNAEKQLCLVNLYDCVVQKLWITAWIHPHLMFHYSAK